MANSVKLHKDGTVSYRRNNRTLRVSAQQAANELDGVVTPATMARIISHDRAWFACELQPGVEICR